MPGRSAGGAARSAVEGKKQAGQAALDWGRAGGRAPPQAGAPQQAGRLTHQLEGIPWPVLAVPVWN